MRRDLLALATELVVDGGNQELVCAGRSFQVAFMEILDGVEGASAGIASAPAAANAGMAGWRQEVQGRTGAQLQRAHGVQASAARSDTIEGVRVHWREAPGSGILALLQQCSSMPPSPAWMQAQAPYMLNTYLYSCIHVLIHVFGP